MSFVSPIQGRSHTSIFNVGENSNNHGERDIFFSKENTVLRASLNPQSVSVIPNAVVADDFKPNVSARDPSKSEFLPPFHHH
jgi:hypothetical protein